jgi:hypothetical protein
LFIGGRETRSFTRNEADTTGSTSITIVDDTVPQTLVDEVALEAAGRVHVDGARFLDAGSNTSDAPSGSTYASVEATSREPRIEWQPHDLHLYNVTHLQLDYRKTGLGQFFFELELLDGGKVAVVEEGAVEHFSSVARWILPPASPGGWNHHILATTSLQWPKGSERPPLPLGRVRAVRFGLLDSEPGARLDLDGVALLRPDGTATIPTEGWLIGGRIRGLDGTPAAKINVRASIDGGRTLETATDADGYYYFYNVADGARVRLSAGAESCPPTRADEFEVRRHDPEWNIDFRECRQARTQ